VSAAGRWALEVLAVLALTWLLPWVGMTMLAPSLAESPLAQRTNFRGHVVFVGLGAAWILWVAGMVVLRWLGGALEQGALGAFVAIGAVCPLVITALLFGLLDDAYGSVHQRGFRGHLAVLGRGRLTTGGLKLIGIGLVSLAAATSVVGATGGAVGPALAAAPGSLSSLAWAVVWTVVLGGVIALSANLVNLLDLRPGRALKGYGAYSALLVAGALVSRATSIGGAIVLGLALFGPLVAVWRFDLRERGMLGDAGANAAGAALGFVAAWECGRSWPALAVLAALLVLNLASERWSFSTVIANNSLLSALDSLGRLKAESSVEGNSAKEVP